MDSGTINIKPAGPHVSTPRLSTGSFQELRSLPRVSKEIHDVSQRTVPLSTFTSSPYHEKFIAVLGLRRCGKSSIDRVMFHKGASSEVFFTRTSIGIRATKDTDTITAAGNSRDLLRASSSGSGLMSFGPVKSDHIGDLFDPSQREIIVGLPQGSIVNVSPFLNYEVWDISSGFLEAFEVHRGMKISMEQDHLASIAMDNLLIRAAVIIFVIDSQDEYGEALAKLYALLVRKSKLNSPVHLHVFIHKMDGLPSETRMEIQQDIEQRLLDEIFDAELSEVFMPTFHLTSIYDFSIYEAFSKVVQKMLPKVDVLENSLNALCAKSTLDKAFLFDAASKIYIATDTSPVETTQYQLCSDMVDAIFDISLVYR